jgi:hypothetical protein
VAAPKTPKLAETLRHALLTTDSPGFHTAWTQSGHLATMAYAYMKLWEAISAFETEVVPSMVKNF